jgi:hypothetical protein
MWRLDNSGFTRTVLSNGPKSTPPVVREMGLQIEPVDGRWGSEWPSTRALGSGALQIENIRLLGRSIAMPAHGACRAVEMEVSGARAALGGAVHTVHWALVLAVSLALHRLSIYKNLLFKFHKISTQFCG